LVQAELSLYVTLRMRIVLVDHGAVEGGGTFLVGEEAIFLVVFDGGKGFDRFAG